jgi:hypothetical protein
VTTRETPLFSCCWLALRHNHHHHHHHHLHHLHFHLLAVSQANLHFQSPFPSFSSNTSLPFSPVRRTTSLFLLLIPYNTPSKVKHLEFHTKPPPPPRQRPPPRISRESRYNRIRHIITWNLFLSLLLVFALVTAPPPRPALCRKQGQPQVTRFGTRDSEPSHHFTSPPSTLQTSPSPPPHPPTSREARRHRVLNPSGPWPSPREPQDA